MVSRYKSTVWVIFLWVAALFLGVYTSQRTQWYHSLVKPPGAPSGAVFSLFWALIYTVLTTAGLSLIHQKKPHAKKTKQALLLFSLLFITNIVWLPMAFTLKSLHFAWVWILFIDVISVVFLIFLVRLSALASVLLMPHIVWLIFATVITHQFISLNS